MRTLLLSLALGTMASVALAAEPLKPTPAQAGPVKLTVGQMDSLTAGDPPKDVEKKIARKRDESYGQFKKCFPGPCK